jgi:signal transduction histidine kinase
MMIVDDQGPGCSVRVQSRGKVIPDADRPLIFQKGFRSQQAMDTVSSGSGLGLYIAKTVADANQCQIMYDAGALRHTDGTGINVFSFSVRSIQ